MNNYKCDDETSNAISSKFEQIVEENNLKQLVDSIDRLNNNMFSDHIPKFVIPKINIVRVDDDDIQSAIEKSFEHINCGSTEKLDKNIVKLQNIIDQDSSMSFDDKFKTTKELRDNNLETSGVVKDKADNYNLEICQKTAFDDAELELLNRSCDEFSKDLNALNFELSSLLHQKAQALSDFDIAYAVKINDKIASVNKALTKKQEEILKFNEGVAERERLYKENYQKLVQDIKDNNFDVGADFDDLVHKYGKKTINDYKNNRINYLIDLYFANMPAADIESSLKDEKLIAVLGDRYDDIVRRFVAK